MKRSLTRKERLRTRSEIARVFDKPDIKSGCKGAKLIARRSNLDYNRFAAVLVRKYGNSAERNYARRVLKEIYRTSKHILPTGYDIIVVLYPGGFGFYERKQQYMDLIWRAGFAKTVQVPGMASFNQYKVLSDNHISAFTAALPLLPLVFGLRG
ncbi:MAG: ribonuclease P protein component [Spirochaeta sp. LUC14_002_19_P3]|nr:MAG: ribonuclease P protein component [Spirochaeta sp. LUC14_002_19_P3]